MQTHLQRTVMFLLTSVAGACAEAEGSSTMETIGVMTSPRQDLPLPAEHRDAKGHRWRSRGRVRFAPETGPSAKAPAKHAAGPTDAEIRAWSDAEWAERLRPIAFSEGEEYERVHPSLDVVAAMRTAQAHTAQERRIPSTVPTQDPSLLGFQGTAPSGGNLDDDRAPLSRATVGDFPSRTVGVLNGTSLQSASKACTM